MVDDLLIREIANGVWFFLAVFMSIGFFRYAIRSWKRRRWEPSVCGAIALGTFFMGSSMRAALAWGMFAAERREDWDRIPWTAFWPWYGSSLILAIIGCLWCIWVFADPHRRNWVLAGISVIAIGIPIAASVLI